MCPSCGRIIPAGATVCPYCQGFVPGVDSEDLHPLIEGEERGYDEPTPDDAPTAEEFGATTLPPPSPPGSSGLVLMAVGLALLVTGVALIITGQLISGSVQSFNQACAAVPGCHPGADVSAGLFGGGVGLTVGGALLVAVGYRRSISWKAWKAPAE